MNSKAETTLIVSDSTCLARMPPGEYQNDIGSTVILDKEKRVVRKGSPALLAGTSKTLLENV